jgi:hypothetical protein
MRRPGLNRRKNPNPKINRQGSRHACRPPIRQAA